MLKIVYIKINTDEKNHYALMNYKNVLYQISLKVKDLKNTDLSQFDCVYSSSTPIDTSRYSDTMKFIFGPSFSIFPEINNMNVIKNNPKVVYILQSEWIANYWKTLPQCSDINIKVLPFGVNTKKFIDNKQINEKTKVFIYFKKRDPNELQFVIDFLKTKNIDYTIFHHSKYNESDYLKYLQDSKYGIWIGSHEFQGFELQETLSCNVPLLVWNVKSMNQEFEAKYDDIPATSIPYWSEQCGEYFYDNKDLETTFNLLLSKLDTYKPRDYILNNLSMNVCENKLIDLIQNM